GIVPARQLGAVEAVVASQLLGAGVPLTQQPAVVAGIPQRLGEGELPVGQILLVADVAFVVRQQLVPEGRVAGEHAGSGGRADRARGVPAVEAGAAAGEGVQVRGAHDGVAVTAQRVGAVLVGEDRQDVARPGGTEPRTVVRSGRDGHSPAFVNRSKVYKSAGA